MSEWERLTENTNTPSYALLVLSDTSFLASSFRWNSGHAFSNPCGCQRGWRSLGGNLYRIKNRRSTHGRLATAAFLFIIVLGDLAWWITRSGQAGQILGRDRENLEGMLQRGDICYVTEITSVLKILGEGILYRVSWRELARIGHEERTSAYEGHFQTHVDAPKDEELMAENPLWIYIMDYSLS